MTGAAPRRSPRAGAPSADGGQAAAAGAKLEADPARPKAVPAPSPMSSPQEDELAGTEQPFVSHLMELRDRLRDILAALHLKRKSAAA